MTGGSAGDAGNRLSDRRLFKRLSRPPFVACNNIPSGSHNYPRRLIRCKLDWLTTNV